jgi:hypothetical protein
MGFPRKVPRNDGFSIATLVVILLEAKNLNTAKITTMCPPVYVCRFMNPMNTLEVVRSIINIHKHSSLLES